MEKLLSQKATARSDSSTTILTEEARITPQMSGLTRHHVTVDQFGMLVAVYLVAIL